MIPTFTRTFRVRFYECDSYGHVNHAHYLRYMQETAFDASADVGYDLTRYEALGSHWLVHESDVEYLAPLRYGDSVTVKTWVLDFQRVRSRRAYELRLAGTGEMIAKATTDWVYVDRHTHHPQRIPPEMVKAFLPDGPPAGTSPRAPFPTPPPTPAGLFTLHRPVSWVNVDPAGHLNNAAYLHYLEDATLADATFRGWPPGRMINEGHFAIVARRYHIRYHQPALISDELEISTWISDVKRATAIRHYTVKRANDQTLLAQARAFWVWVDFNTGRIIRIPPNFIADFAPNISPVK